jgi:hypothetical protein
MDPRSILLASLVGALPLVAAPGVGAAATASASASRFT